MKKIHINGFYLLGAAILPAVITGGISFLMGQKANQNITIDTLTTTINTGLVDKNKPYQETITDISQYVDNLMVEQSIAKKDISDFEKENNELKLKLGNYESENKQLTDNISTMKEVQFSAASINKNGYLEEENISNAVAIIDNKNYFSEQFIKTIIEDFTYNIDKSMIILDNGKSPTVDKVGLFDTNVLYDGDSYTLYKPSGAYTFTMAGKDYTDGFVFTGDAFALLNLENKYSSMTFTVGRLDSGNIVDATLQIYLDGQLTKEYFLDSQKPPVKLEVPLKYATSLKVLLDNNSYSNSYGLANVRLKY